MRDIHTHTRGRCCCCCCCFIPRSLRKQHDPHQPPLLLPTSPENDAVCSTNCICFSAIAGMVASWLNHCRMRYLLLILCSPFLLPLFFATCPLICAFDICCFLCRKRRKKAEDRGRRRDEETGDRGGLLQRYLEDQVLLVIGSVDADGNLRQEEDDGVDVGYSDSARPLVQ